MLGCLVALLAVAQVETSTNTFRAGLLTGEPIGLSFFAPLGEQLAFQVELGHSISERRFLTVAADVIWRLPEVFGNVGPTGFLLPWFGFGGRLFLIDRDHSVVVPGLRGPIGVSYLDRETPLEIYLEVVPGVEIDSAGRVSLEGGLGVRVWVD